VNRVAAKGRTGRTGLTVHVAEVRARSPLLATTYSD
jgi:hypothetical protein